MNRPSIEDFPDRWKAVRLGLWLGASLLAAGAAGAATWEAGRPLLQSWSTADYDGHAQNWSLLHEPDGVLLFGNRNGIYELDGVRFRFAPSPQRNRVGALAGDDEGRVYFGTRHDFGSYEPGPDGARRMISWLDRVPEDAVERAREVDEILQILVDGESVYFRGVFRIFRFDRQGRFVRLWPADLPIAHLFPLGGELYVHRGQERGIARLVGTGAAGDPDETVGRMGSFDSVAGHPVLASSTRTALKQPDGSVVLPLFDGSFVRFDGERVEPLEVDLPFAGTSRPLTDAVQLGDGRRVVSVAGAGIFILDEEWQIERRLTAGDGLLSDTAYKLAIGRQGELWLAQYGGIVRLLLDHPLSVYDKALGLPDGNGLTRYRGRLVAAGVTGLRLLLPPEPRFALPRFAELPDAGFVRRPTPTAAGLVFDRREELVLLAGPPESWLDRPVPEAAELLLANGSHPGAVVRPRAEPGRLWVLADGTLHLFELQRNRWREVGAVTTGAPLRNYLTEAPPDSPGCAWLGSETGRAARLCGLERDAPTGDASVELFGEADGLPPGNVVPALVRDRVVFLTGRGLMTHAADRQPSFQPATRPGVLTDPETMLFRLVEDPKGELWIDANAGRTGKVVQDTAGEDRIDTTLFDLLPHTTVFDWLAEDDGIVWVLRAQDLLRIDTTKPYAPPPVIEPLVRRVTTTVGEATRPVAAGDLPASGPVALERDDGRPERVRIELALPFFDGIEKTRYRTRIAPQEWSSWSDEAFRDLTFLPGGTHRFEVQARDAYGRLSPVAGVALVMPHPWYLTPLAKGAWGILAALVIGGAAWGGGRLRAARLERWNRELEQVIDERTAKVRQQAEEARLTTARRSRLLASVSHEFRTPITLILASIAELKGRDRPEEQAAVARAERHAYGMLGLVSQAIDLDRLEEGANELRVSEVEFSHFVSDLADRFEPLARKQRIDLLRRIEPGLRLTLDSRRIDGAVSNLLSNAFKFTPPGGSITLEVRHVDSQLSARAGGRGAVRVAVRDSGPGIAAEQEPAALFEAYRRGTTPASPGSGLGLALVREAVEHHGGSVGARDRGGNGAEFWVELPLGVEHFPPEVRLGDQPADADAASEPYLALDAAERDRFTVLLVEDNEELRDYLRMRLEPHFRLLVAGDGEEALAVVGGELPDLIVSDLVMPKLDGLELTHLIKTNPETAEIPIVLLTGSGDHRHIAEAMALGADAYLHKPVSVSEVTAHINGLIARRQTSGGTASADPIDRALAPMRDEELRERLQRVLVERLFDPDFGVEELASAAYLGRSTLFRRLKEELDTAPAQLLRDLRLEAAALELRGGAVSVADVAYGVGFSSQSYFARAFKARFGESPRDVVRASAAKATSFPDQSLRGRGVTEGEASASPGPRQDET